MDPKVQFTLNSEILTGIQGFAVRLRDEIDLLDAERDRLLSELGAAESTLESMRTRMPAESRLPKDSLFTEPRVPSDGSTLGPTTAVGTPNGVNHRNGPEPSIGGDEPQQMRMARPTNGTGPPPVEEDESGQRRWMRLTRAVNYSGAEVFLDRVRCVAEATEDGKINCTHVAEILIRDGLSRSSKSNLRGTVQTYLAKCAEYERIGPGTYQYLPMAGVGDD